jgi:hypothetical protein
VERVYTVPVYIASRTQGSERSAGLSDCAGAATYTLHVLPIFLLHTRTIFSSIKSYQWQLRFCVPLCNKKQGTRPMSKARNFFPVKVVEDGSAKGHLAKGGQAAETACELPKKTDCSSGCLRCEGCGKYLHLHHPLAPHFKSRLMHSYVSPPLFCSKIKCSILVP